MVAFKILLRYKGSQQTANTTTRQKTVLATSRLCRGRVETFKFACRQNITTAQERWETWSHVVAEGSNLLGVVASLGGPQHFPGHQCVENGGPSQRQAEVEAEEPPVLYSFIELLIKHGGGSWSELQKTRLLL